MKLNLLNLKSAAMMLLCLVAIGVHAQSNKDVTPAGALRMLMEGNQHFLNGKNIDGQELLKQVKATAGSQSPFAAVVSCLDSRIPPEMVFHQGIGDLFIARVAGNFVNDDILGSIEYATTLDPAIQLIAIMGHTSCGAVKGACAEAQLGLLTGTLANINPAVRVVAERRPGENPTSPEFVQDVVETNVLLTMQNLRDRSLVLRKNIDSGKLKLVGAMYDLKTGKVRFHELKDGKLVPIQ